MAKKTQLLEPKTLTLTPRFPALHRIKIESQVEICSIELGPRSLNLIILQKCAEDCLSERRDDPDPPSAVDARHERGDDGGVVHEARRARAQVRQGFHDGGQSAAIYYRIDREYFHLRFS